MKKMDPFRRRKREVVGRSAGMHALFLLPVSTPEVFSIGFVRPNAPGEFHINQGIREYVMENWYLVRE